MGRLLALTAAAMLLARCREAADEPSRNQANAPPDDAAATPASYPDSISTTPVDRETALRLMDERHENMEEIGDSMKRITRELKDAEPDLARVREEAATVAGLAPQIPSWFPAGSGPDVGETEALAEIWRKPDDFAAKAQAMEEAALAFQAAAQGTDLAAIRAAQGGLGKSCKACHDLYRAKDE